MFNKLQTMFNKLNTFEKIQFGLIVFALVLVLVTLFCYFLFFNGSISEDQELWAYFGDYMGGVLNPLLSFITIIILIFTVGISYRTLSMAREELQHYRNESLKSELLDVIKETDLEIQRIFERTADFSASGNNFGYYFSYSATGVSIDDIPVDGKYTFSTNDRVSLCDLSELIQKMDGYLDQYDKTFGESARTYHYKSKYRNIYYRLTKKGYLFKEHFKAFESIGYGWSAPSKKQ